MQLQVVGGGGAAWDVLLHRGPCHVLSGGTYMIKSTKVKDLRGGIEMYDVKDQLLCVWPDYLICKVLLIM